MGFTRKKNLADADDVHIRISAMDFLARREHSEAELISKLVSKGAAHSAALGTVKQLQKENLQCDKRFVESLVNSSVRKGRGIRRIELDLSGHGIDSSFLYDALDELNIDWVDVAYDVYTKKYGLSWEDDYQDRAKRMRFMQSRGFDVSDINHVFGRIRHELTK